MIMMNYLLKFLKLTTMMDSVTGTIIKISKSRREARMKLIMTMTMMDLGIGAMTMRIP